MVTTGAVVTAAALVPGAALAGTVTAKAATAKAVRVKPPANAKPGSGALLQAVSCVRPRSCTAGGDYVDSAGHDQAMVVAESNGRWARGQELRMPPGTPAQPFAELNAISCAAAGSCLAGGSFEVGGTFIGFVATESHGTWGRALRLAPPASAPASASFVVSALSCTGPGACVVIGGYRDKHGNAQIFAVTQSKGTWGKATELRMPPSANANPDALAFGVSCARAGTCVTVGIFNNLASVTRPLSVTESGGKWRQGSAISLPRGTSATSTGSALAVSCPAPGSCVAVGSYTDAAAGAQAFTVTQSKGRWQRAALFTKLPSNAAANPAPALTGVSCPAPGSCAAVGGYTDMAGGSASLAAFRHGGRWLGGIEIIPPPGAAVGGVLNTSMRGVSCTSTPFCAAVGDYGTKAGPSAAMGAALSVPATSG